MTHLLSLTIPGQHLASDPRKVESSFSLYPLQRKNLEVTTWTFYHCLLDRPIVRCLRPLLPLLSCQDWRQVVRWGGVDVWRLTSVKRRYSTWPPYTLVRYTVKTDTTDIQSVDSDRVEKRSCEIELSIQYGTCHCSPACEDRRRTRWYMYIYSEVIYTNIRTYILIHIYVCVCVCVCMIQTSKYSFNILDRNFGLQWWRWSSVTGRILDV